MGQHFLGQTFSGQTLSGQTWFVLEVGLAQIGQTWFGQTWFSPKLVVLAKLGLAKKLAIALLEYPAGLPKSVFDHKKESKIKQEFTLSFSPVLGLSFPTFNRDGQDCAVGPDRATAGTDRAALPPDPTGPTGPDGAAAGRRAAGQRPRTQLDRLDQTAPPQH